MIRAATAFAVVSGLAACSQPAAEGPNLLVPDDIEVRWSRTFDAEGDGLAALVPVDFMVYDAQSGEPVAGMPLRVQAVDAALDSALLVVSPGEIDLSTGGCADCAVWWDAWRDQYFEFTAEADPSTALSTETDATGLARVYVFVDRFGAAQGAGPAFRPAQVAVSIDADDASEPAGDETFLLMPR